MRTTSLAGPADLDRAEEALTDAWARIEPAIRASDREAARARLAALVIHSLYRGLDRQGMADHAAAGLTGRPPTQAVG